MQCAWAHRGACPTAAVHSPIPASTEKQTLLTPSLAPPLTPAAPSDEPGAGIPASLCGVLSVGFYQQVMRVRRVPLVVRGG